MTRASMCFDGCGRAAVGYSAYCNECAERHNAAKRPLLPPGSPWCKCGECFRVFRNVSGFDAHRSSKGEHGGCLDPTEVGLVERDGLWATPEGHEDREARKRRLSRNTDRRSHPGEGDDTGGQS